MPRPKARQLIREETPRKGRDVSDASRRPFRVRRTIVQAKKATAASKKLGAEKLLRKFNDRSRAEGDLA